MTYIILLRVCEHGYDYRRLGLLSLFWVFSFLLFRCFHQDEPDP